MAMAIPISTFLEAEVTLSIWGTGKEAFPALPVKAVEAGVGRLQASPVFYDVNGDGFADEIDAYSGFNDTGGATATTGSLPFCWETERETSRPQPSTLWGAIREAGLLSRATSIMTRSSTLRLLIRGPPAKEARS